MSSIIQYLKGFLTAERKNVLKISYGTIMGQLISMVTIPIMTRLYGAVIIGVWTILNSVAQIGYSVSDLALSNAIMIEDDENKTQTIYQVISTVSLLVSVLTGFISFAYFAFTEFPEGIYPIFLVLYIMCAVFTLQQIQICYTWLNRVGEYNVLMKNPILNNLTFAAFSIFLAILGMKRYGYFIGWLLGQAVTLLHMKRHLPKHMFTHSIEDFLYVVKKHRRFVQYQLPNNVVGTFKNQLPTLLIRSFFGTETLGYYSITVKIMTVPVGFLATAMGRVFFQHTAELKRRGEPLGEYVYRSVSDTMKIGVIPLLVILGIGDVLTNWFLGNGWEMSGVFIRIMVVQNFFLFQMNTMMGISSVLEKQNYSLISSIAQCAGFAAGMSIGKYVFDNPHTAVALMSATFVIIHCVYFSMLFRCVHIPVRRYLVFLVRNVGFIFLGAFLLRYVCVLLGFAISF